MLLFISKLFFKEGIINKLIEMNSLIKICPYCKKHMKYALDKQFIKMNCKCGFSSSMNIKNIPIGDNNNHIFKEIKKLEEQGKLFVIRPKQKLDIGKTEKDPNKLEMVYQEGRSMALEILPSLISYLS